MKKYNVKGRPPKVTDPAPEPATKKSRPRKIPKGPVTEALDLMVTRHARLAKQVQTYFNLPEDEVMAIIEVSDVPTDLGDQLDAAIVKTLKETGAYDLRVPWEAVDAYVKARCPELAFAVSAVWYRGQRAWLDAGFPLYLAARWADEGFDAETAIGWRYHGYSPKKAVEAWKKSMWTSDSAIKAYEERQQRRRVEPHA